MPLLYLHRPPAQLAWWVVTPHQVTTLFLVSFPQRWLLDGVPNIQFCAIFFKVFNFWKKRPRAWVFSWALVFSTIGVKTKSLQYARCYDLWIPQTKGPHFIRTEGQCELGKKESLQKVRSLSLLFGLFSFSCCTRTVYKEPGQICKEGVESVAFAALKIIHQQLQSCDGCTKKCGKPDVSYLSASEQPRKRNRLKGRFRSPQFPPTVQVSIQS